MGDWLQTCSRLPRRASWPAAPSPDDDADKHQQAATHKLGRVVRLLGVAGGIASGQIGRRALADHSPRQDPLARMNMHARAHGAAGSHMPASPGSGTPTRLSAVEAATLGAPSPCAVPSLSFGRNRATWLDGRAVGSALLLPLVVPFRASDTVKGLCGTHSGPLSEPCRLAVGACRVAVIPAGTACRETLEQAANPNPPASRSPHLRTKQAGRCRSNMAAGASRRSVQACTRGATQCGAAARQRAGGPVRSANTAERATLQPRGMFEHRSGRPPHLAASQDL
jgi:hypothetical protein